MARFSNIVKTLFTKDGTFLRFLEKIEVLIAKFLSILMIAVILFAVSDLCIFLVTILIPKVLTQHSSFSKGTLFEAFGLFLNVLIALEILENITVYLKQQVVQYELVIVTSLIAVARKIIIFDLEKKQAIDLIALSIAVFTLSVSYLIVRMNNRQVDRD
ncbi:phosphate-starvation-inducible PsiE family protein [Oscillatoriales cyanobacterium LEGE 11467]|uniref:Phosphate-starvation-inducible PsiE family protein n=1 Tax=Zarconia navalis LEGE 11467 TaxID=1828826 RepID=A0A928VUY1_9CYAN|nr:phosphate-starvation-inducible PsiE family protein [Zarconia navalis]MBE9039768.1 phosphate-starvation-inducible PsiE family protein [Zarconia navalis LEGE 11467]